ncbi:UDP-N-acetylmuramoyl-tripeptide--D-alanyl-D-alanine ligase [Clostridium sp. SYSU_GA19001]|uniref:UDP-N-acetylmuramoyl-tripeptide--D-alanyl-D- alanine ligase n=1 Tax=Clostridium caldaquaticum TaxID=2940653 RepID=UPI0020772B13|nr:UDP-N-acetylmuramoyl-tripeptide--D-alanyl-D-alanine ligase [Clostridium caldaquaticum]MCM8711005.1 UDP-N-acetylmuramoyl-tripeptide--D-alanyl-D-alanine ligase [Clostridium caldaquaticum]
MENLTFVEIVEAVHGKIIKEGKEVTYESVSTDTRTIKENSIFIALKGEKFNGNDYAAEASIKGARLCIVDELKCSLEDFSNNTFVVKVQDGKKALLDLSKYYRSKLNLKVVGITGSTGKTSTKDLVAAVLSSKYKVFKTKGNFNNEIGLPLMVFNLDNSYDVAVLEMGMSSLGEIHRLAEVARPDIAIITNIGVSHIEYLKTRENILKAKLEITDFFNKENSLIINADNDLLKRVGSSNYKVVRVGMEEKHLDLKAVEIYLGEDCSKFRVSSNYEETSSEFFINVPGKHNISNSLLAIACGKILGLSYQEMIEGIKNLEFTSMRLDILRGKKFTIIDDSYNASPDSMKAAIDVLCNMNGNKKIAVLGTMKELGDKSSELHREVAEYASFRNIDELIVVGEYAEVFSRGFNNDKKFKAFSSNDEAVQYINTIINKDDVVLVKASRSMKFETIVKELKIINY